jgi:hypothetical protein
MMQLKLFETNKYISKLPAIIRFHSWQSLTAFKSGSKGWFELHLSALSYGQIKGKLTPVKIENTDYSID